MFKKILFIFFSISMSSQNIKVEYSLNILKDESVLKKDGISTFYKNAMDGAKNVKFELLIDKDKSFFYKKDILNQNTIETKMALLISEADNPIYSFNNNIFKKIEETSSFFNKPIIVKDTLLTNWELTNETKKINGYTCYKAAAKYKIVNPDVFYHSVIAWYCPEIPSQMGPRGFGGLPGLILELQYREIVFGATLIEKTNDPVIINFNSEIITQEQYDKKILEIRNN